jgi:small-conductance mechanosensitive channel
MVLNCYVGNIDAMSRVRHELNAAIVRAFREHHVECAYPQREVTVHFANEHEAKVEAAKRRSA